jgi:hypothetical protein
MISDYLDSLAAALISDGNSAEMTEAEMQIAFGSIVIAGRPELALETRRR